MFGRCHDIAANARVGLDLHGEAAQTNARPFGLVTQPLELAARPADDIDIDPLGGSRSLVIEGNEQQGSNAAHRSKCPSHTSHIAQMPRNGGTGSQPVSSNLIASKHSADKGT